MRPARRASPHTRRVDFAVHLRPHRNATVSCARATAPLRLQRPRPPLKPCGFYHAHTLRKLSMAPVRMRPRAYARAWSEEQEYYLYFFFYSRVAQACPFAQKLAKEQMTSCSSLRPLTIYYIGSFLAKKTYCSSRRQFVAKSGSWSS